MCLIAVAWQASPQFPLVFAANRDEFHDRPSAPASWWPDPGGVLGGLDLRAGGSWLAVDERGRLAAVTNYRGAAEIPANARSRGHLVRDFLLQGDSPTDYLQKLKASATQYSPFNLLLASAHGLAYYSNQGREPHQLPAGIYGLSNALLDTPWPKVERLKATLNRAIQGPDPASALFKTLADTTTADDHLLPDTGLGIEMERRLSAPFILSPSYGTRCSTVVVLSADGTLHFAERRFDAAGDLLGSSNFDIPLA